MIDLKRLEKDSHYFESYKQSLKNRKEDVSSLEKILSLNAERKRIVFETEKLIVDRRNLEKDFVQSKSDDLKSSAKKIGDKISELQNDLKKIENQLQSIALTLPNICHKDVPISDKNNVIVRKIGKPKDFPFLIQSHFNLTKENIDFERASKVTGARFSFLRGEVAQLERALAHFMIDTHTKKNNYQELHIPFIVNKHSLKNTGQLPKFEQDLFRLDRSDYYLIPTAEVPVTNFFAREILNERDLPYKFVSCSPCFRAEAGSYGKDVKGLIRQHQFTKVELVTFSHPEKSYEELETLTSNAEIILRDLELPYQVVSLCTGDIGFSAAKCYDLEVWIPSEKTYREISSCSNCEDFQARRAQIRYKSHSNKPQFVHTLNGSGLAVGRTLIAILENYQQEDGSVAIPKKLQPYMDNKQGIFNSKNA